MIIQPFQMRRAYLSSKLISTLGPQLISCAEVKRAVDISTTDAVRTMERAKEPQVPATFKD